MPKPCGETGGSFRLKEKGSTQQGSVIGQGPVAASEGFRMDVGSGGGNVRALHRFIHGNLKWGTIVTPIFHGVVFILQV